MLSLQALSCPMLRAPAARRPLAHGELQLLRRHRGARPGDRRARELPCRMATSECRRARRPRSCVARRSLPRARAAGHRRAQRSAAGRTTGRAARARHLQACTREFGRRRAAARIHRASGAAGSFRAGRRLLHPPPAAAAGHRRGRGNGQCDGRGLAPGVGASAPDRLLGQPARRAAGQPARHRPASCRVDSRRMLEVLAFVHGEGWTHRDLSRPMRSCIRATMACCSSAGRVRSRPPDRRTTRPSRAT